MKKKIVGLMPSGGGRRDWLLYALPKLNETFSKIPNFVVYVFIQDELINDFGVFKFIQKEKEDIVLFARRQKYAKELLEIDPEITHILSIDDDVIINYYSENLVNNFIHAFDAIYEDQADVIHLNFYTTFYLRPFSLLDLEMQTFTYQVKGIIFPICLYFNEYPWSKTETDRISAGEDNFTFLLCLYNGFRIFIAYGFEDFLHLHKDSTSRRFDEHFPQFSGLTKNREKEANYNFDMSIQCNAAPWIFPIFFNRPYSQDFLLHPKIYQIIQLVKEGKIPYDKYYTGIRIKNAQASTELKPANNLLKFNFDDRWESKWTDEPQWLVCDLGLPHQVNFILIHWEFASASNYHISGSNDGKEWELLKGVYDKFSYRSLVIYLNSNYRYYKFDFLTRNTKFGYSIFNILFYE